MSAAQVAEELAGVRIEPGLWEISTRVESASAEGLPRQLMQRMRRHGSSARHCITPEQAERPNANFLAAREGSDCTYRDFAMRGGRISGSMACRSSEDGAQTRVRMSGFYRPESYDIRMAMEMPGLPGGGPLSVETRATGRRVGVCPPDREMKR